MVVGQSVLTINSDSGAGSIAGSLRIFVFNEPEELEFIDSDDQVRIRTEEMNGDARRRVQQNADRRFIS